jgi:uncharacterized protein
MLNDNLRSENSKARFQPVASGERIDSIDVLRGFAIFGVLIAYAVWSLGTPPFDTYTTTDQITNFVLAILVDSKFYTLLSFLFGLGFSIQLARARERGTNIVPVFVRRLLAMMLFGFAHALLLRNGDILVPYATIGFLLLIFRNASNKTLLAVGVGGAFVPVIARWIWEMSGIPLPMRPNTDGMSHLWANLAWMKYWYSSAITIWPDFIPMFMFGLYVGRKRIFENISAHKKALRWFVVAGFVVGAGVFIGRLVLLGMTEPSESRADPVNQILMFSWHVHAWGFAAFYAASILLLLQRRRIQDHAVILAAVGRMSLTNYLLQSIIIVPICIAFSLYDRVTPGLGLLLAVVVALVQIPASVLWLRHFRFGPAEWLWRSITYRQLQPMRLEAAGTLSRPALSARRFEV